MQPSPKDRRRSQRVSSQIPIVLKGSDAAGRGFFDRAEILSVDQHGARIRTRFQLKVGSEVEVHLPSNEAPKRVRVVWRGGVGSFEEGMVGIELVDPKESWNIDLQQLP